MATILTLILCSYLLGALPFGFLIAKIWKVDILSRGSGNIGATNVLRALGPIPGVTVLTLDLLKGTLTVVLVSLAVNNPWIITLAGAAAILGHSYSVFLKFRGGKSVATGLGVLLGIAPDIFVAAAILAVLIIFFTRHVSIGSISTAVAVTISFWSLNRPLPYNLLATAATGLIILRHIPNIKRLLQGEEPKIGEET